MRVLPVLNTRSSHKWNLQQLIHFLFHNGNLISSTNTVKSIFHCSMFTTSHALLLHPIHKWQEYKYSHFSLALSTGHFSDTESLPIEFVPSGILLSAIIYRAECSLLIRFFIHYHSKMHCCTKQWKVLVILYIMMLHT